MKKTNATVTDLGVARVESAGKRDVVTIAHNNIVAFKVTCDEPGTVSRVTINKLFLAMDQERIDEVIKAYSHWKRRTLPNFALPNHSGLTRDGHKHPWRKKKEIHTGGKT